MTLLYNEWEIFPSYFLGSHQIWCRQKEWSGKIEEVGKTVHSPLHFRSIRGDGAGKYERACANGGGNRAAPLEARGTRCWQSNGGNCEENCTIKAQVQAEVFTDLFQWNSGEQNKKIQLEKLGFGHWRTKMRLIESI